jgi:hypothetical protein
MINNMTAYLYRGDTPGKKKARDTLYQLATIDIGPKRFSEEINVIVASRFCGDIKYLLSRGSPLSNILACDTDEQSRVMAASYGVPISPHPDIADTMRWAHQQYGDKVATVNFDLCHTVLKVDLLEKVLEYTPISTTVLYTFMRGRADKMHSQQERLDYLSRNIRANIRYTNYQSNSDGNVGSPMCAAILNSIGESWFWDGEKDMAKIEIVDLNFKKHIYPIAKPKTKLKSDPEINFIRLPPPGISVFAQTPTPDKTQSQPYPQPFLKTDLLQTDLDRHIETVLLEQITNQRKKLNTDSVSIGPILAEKLLGLSMPDIIVSVQKSSKLWLFPSTASYDPIIVAADDPYCSYHQKTV